MADIDDRWAGRSTASGAPYGKLRHNQCKEQFSIAYVHAVATAAQCSLSDPKVDDEKVDVTIRQTANHLLYDAAAVDVQLKATERPIMHNDGLHFSMPTAHFDALRSVRTYNPKILVVMQVPVEPAAWLSFSETGIHMQHKAYWVNLRGLAQVVTADTTVVVPKDNVFDPEQLLDMLHRIGRDEAA